MHRPVQQGAPEHSRGQHDGHRVVQHALPEQQRVQVPVSVQLVEDGQHGDCRRPITQVTHVKNMLKT